MGAAGAYQGVSPRGAPVNATHLTIASVDRAVLYADDASLLAAVRTVAAIGGTAALLFCVVDDHAHAVLGTDRSACGTLARSLAYALGVRLPVELAPSRLRSVASRSHLVSLVRYVLDQPRKHGLQHAGHPALWPGSCFVDLVGARLLDGFDPRWLAAALPRLGRREIYDAVGLAPVAPLDDEGLRAEGPRRIGDAAAAALGLPELSGRTAPVVRARRAAARLSRGLGFGDPQTAFGLRCPTSTASRLARSALPDAALDRAIRMQLALRRCAVSVAAAGPFQGPTRGTTPAGDAHFATP